MSDLISRNRAISILEQLDEHSLSGKMDISNAIYLLENQPAAYDIDKVVVELNELDVKSITRYKNGNFGNFDGVEYYIKKRKAIEIVKQGGVSDDVCEWESHYKFVSDKYKRETGCGYTFYDLHHAVPFKYCPYCGKRIKVVE